MAEHALQVVIRKPSAGEPLTVGTRVKHKSFGEGVIEARDENTRTYTIRFLIGVKPIRFEYQGISEIF